MATLIDIMERVLPSKSLLRVMAIGISIPVMMAFWENLPYVGMSSPSSCEPVEAPPSCEPMETPPCYSPESEERKFPHTLQLYMII